MSILVVCPNCHKSFKVSDKFAGKSGPCPSCKNTIKVPEKTGEVKVHGAEEFSDGGRGRSGEMLTKPVAREETTFHPVVAAGIAAGVLLVLAISFIAGKVIAGSLVVRGVGLLLLSPALVMAAYTFLRNDELEPYRGLQLWIRALICGTVYTVLWGVFAYVSRVFLFPEPELWQWMFVIPPFVALGGVAPNLSLDLDYGNGALHYVFYVLLTVLLAWVAGMGWVWQGPPTGVI